MSVALAAGTPTSIGSLPHRDPAEAAEFVLARHPALPAAPQLPNRSRRGGMVAEACAGLRGVTIGADGAPVVDVHGVDPDAPLTRASATSAPLSAFLGAVGERVDPIKVQLTGPVTLGLALVHAGAPAPLAFRVAGNAVTGRARALVSLVRRRAPGAPVVAFVDEPGLTVAGHPGFPLGGDEVVDLVGPVVDALAPATTGVHCCGPTDWRTVVDAGVRLLSLPAVPAVTAHAEVIGRFLDAGGRIVWGAVPTTGPLAPESEPLWRRLTALWRDLVHLGCDAGLLRRSALVSPVCGLANHGESQADLVLRLTTELGARVRDQAVAMRLSVGA